MTLAQSGFLRLRGEGLATLSLRLFVGRSAAFRLVSFWLLLLFVALRLAFRHESSLPRSGILKVLHVARLARCADTALYFLRPIM